jgi:hypothetical protein
MFSHNLLNVLVQIANKMGLQKNLGFEVLKAVVMNVAILWDITP